MTIEVVFLIIPLLLLVVLGFVMLALRQDSKREQQTPTVWVKRGWPHSLDEYHLRIARAALARFRAIDTPDAQEDYFLYLAWQVIQNPAYDPLSGDARAMVWCFREELTSQIIQEELTRQGITYETRVTVRAVSRNPYSYVVSGGQLTESDLELIPRRVNDRLRRYGLGTDFVIRETG